MLKVILVFIFSKCFTESLPGFNAHSWKLTPPNVPSHPFEVSVQPLAWVQHQPSDPHHEQGPCFLPHSYQQSFPMDCWLNSTSEICNFTSYVFILRKKTKLIILQSDYDYSLSIFTCYLINGIWVISSNATQAVICGSEFIVCFNGILWRPAFSSIADGKDLVTLCPCSIVTRFYDFTCVMFVS